MIAATETQSVAIAGTLIGIYPNKNLGVAQLHIARQVGQGLREFYVTCGLRILPTGLELGSHVDVDATAQLGAADISSAGELEIRATYIGMSVSV